jgi:hypothetical protein
MDSVMQQLSNLGAMGVIIALLAYDVFYLQKKLLQVIENNTKAMSDLKEFCRIKNGGDI